MLHKETIDRATLELLISLQSKKYLEGFCLVGGTGLALQMGHRQSIDIDLFSDFSFDTISLLESIQQDYEINLVSTSSNTIKGIISGIMVDLIARRYPYLKEPVNLEEITFLSVEDILAMKLNAIAMSGERSKDFVDIYFALERYSISQIVNFYKEKYNQNSGMHVLKSLIYFDDVDLSDWPVIISKKDLKWNDVKKRIERSVLAFLKNK
ncbi:MAG: nucleotidyl transferase AbiEii/AbiGii toxin family protein [bacterium]